MNYIKENTDFKLEKSSAVTLGKFDGVHSGHQKLISVVNEKAKECNLLSVVFTFDTIPLSLCPQPSQHFITTNSERKRIIDNLGVDVLVEYPFTDSLMNTEAEAFVKDILVDRLNAKVVVVGPDYTFGKAKSGNVEYLTELAPKYGFEVIIIEKEKYETREISSTFVKEELSVGHMETVNMLLARPFSICGVIAKGKQLGRTLNIPTVNIYPPENKLLPPFGVYASESIIDGEKYYGVTNIGTKPTVSNSSSISVETNLFDFDEDVYGKNIEVCLKHFLRQEMKFDGVESLQKQMESDANFAKEMFMI